MKRLTLTLLSSLIALSGCTGCGKPQVYGQPDLITEKFLKERLSFDSAQVGHPMDASGITFTFFHETMIGAHGMERHGVCDYNAKNVSLSLTTSRQELYLNFLHEFGHCKLGKSHDNSHPNIMNSKVNPMVLDAFYSDKRLEYIKELLN